MDIELGMIDPYMDYEYLITRMDAWVETIDIELKKEYKNNGLSDKYNHKFKERIVTYDEFGDLFADIPPEEWSLCPAYYFFEIDKYSDRQKILQKYTHDEISYARLVKAEATPALNEFFFKSADLRSFVPYATLAYNTVISGSIGSGKTTVMKTIIYDLYKSHKPAQIVIDPQGNFSTELMKLKGIKEEDMIFFEPKLDSNYSPVINFLDIRKDQDPHSIAIRLARMLTILCDDLSPAMLSLLRPCITVLLEAGGYSILDLKKFMLKDEGKELIEMGLNYPDEEFQSTFRRINDSYYTKSKEAIIARLDILAQDRDFRRITTGKSTIDLKQAIDDGKIIIFNLGGKLEQDTREAFGRLLVGLVTSIAFERTPDELETCKRIFFHIDELQNFLSDDIIRGFDQARQKKLHFVVAHQRIGQLKGSLHANKEENFMDSLIGNSGVKIIGHNESPDTLNLYSTKLGIPKEKLHALKNYHFRLHVRGKTDIEFKSSNTINEKRMYLDEEGTKNRIQYMIDQGYYRPIGAPIGYVMDTIESKPVFDQPRNGKERIILEDDDF